MPGTTMPIRPLVRVASAAKKKKPYMKNRRLGPSSRVPRMNDRSETVSKTVTGMSRIMV